MSFAATTPRRHNIIVYAYALRFFLLLIAADTPLRVFFSLLPVSSPWRHAYSMLHIYTEAFADISPDVEFRLMLRYFQQRLYAYV